MHNSRPTPPPAFGHWKSPITPARMAASYRLHDAMLTDAGDVVWLETRAGESILKHESAGELTERGTKVRGGVGYGGGEFWLNGERLYVVGNQGRLYRIDGFTGFSRPITPGFGGAAAPCTAPAPDWPWVVYVHQYEGADVLAVVDAEGKQYPRRLVSGHDFLAQPRISPDGSLLAYISWEIPAMPWDSATLWLASLETDATGLPYIAGKAPLAGGDDVSAAQPEFSPDGTRLAYLCDEAGWVQPYVRHLASGAVTRLANDEAEYGLPNWVQGLRTLAWRDANTLLAVRSQGTAMTLVGIDVATGAHTDLTHQAGDYTDFRQIHVNAAGDCIVIASSATRPETVVRLGDATPVTANPLARLPHDILTEGAPVTWPGYDGEPVFGVLYMPMRYAPDNGRRPPLIVIVHGGPTSQARQTFQMDAQFFASRGYAVLYVNHRGSTGYGKAYKDRHRGQWGVYDVQDSAAGARWLADSGQIDPERRVIYGGSAGGYTVLQSLVDLPGFWTAGVSLYGIGNQFTLVSEATFKFEAHYSETLLGRLPDAAQVYRDRSPLFHAEKIVDPVLLMQGEDDDVVPRSQSDQMAAALKSRGVPHEYVVFPGEGHGWRKPETIEASFTRTLKFLETYVLYR
jgi:dipeptidyl aminopeptidase/acylaminoacyl peptidase